MERTDGRRAVSAVRTATATPDAAGSSDVAMGHRNYRAGRRMESPLLFGGMRRAFAAAQRECLARMEVLGALIADLQERKVIG